MFRLCGRLNNGPQISMSSSQEPVTVTFHGKRDFAHMINLRILDQEIIWIIQVGLNVITSILIQGRQNEIHLQREGDMMMEIETDAL